MTARRGMGAHHGARPQTEIWLTPPAILESLGGWRSFALDPCAAPEPRPWPTARLHYTEPQDGLSLPWSGRVYLNSPYSRGKVERWLCRMAEHNFGTALIFARTETEAFRRFVWDQAAAVLFISGRLSFHRRDGTVQLTESGGPANSGAPSVLCAYGQGDADVLAACGIDGKFIPLLIPRSWLIERPESTWLEAVCEWWEARESVRLDDLYRAFEHHRKARRNPNYRAKLRQVMQLGPFERTGRGEWRRA